MRAFRSHLKRQEQGRRKNLAWRRRFNRLLSGGTAGWAHGTGPIEYHAQPPVDLIGDQEVLVDRFFVDTAKCLNDNVSPPRPPSKPAEATQRYGKPVPDLEKIKTWANVLNDKQYGYGTDAFAQALIAKNRHDMIPYERITSPKADQTFRIVSYNVHAFLNSFACIVSAEPKQRSVVSGQDVARLMASLRADIVCLQEFTGLPWGNELRLHGFKHLYDAVARPASIGDALVTQGEVDMPNFLGVAIFAVGPTQLSRPVVGRAKRSRIHPPYDEPFRPFLCTTITVHGVDVELWNIHPEAVSFSKQDNQDQLAGLFRDLSKQRKPILVVGDYNCETVQPFLCGTFELHPGQWHPSYTKDRPVYTSWAGSYIDHVCSNQAFRDHLRIDVTVVPADLSDHFPVQMDIFKKLLKK